MNVQWHKTGIQLPPGWHDAIADRAREVGLPIRYIYMVAVDHVLGLPPEEIKRLGRELRDRGDDDFEALVRRRSSVPLAHLNEGNGALAARTQH